MVSNAKIDREAKTLMKQTGIPLWLAREYVIENTTTTGPLADENHPLHVLSEKYIEENCRKHMIAIIDYDLEKICNYSKPYPKQRKDHQEYARTIVELAQHYCEHGELQKFIFLCGHHYNLLELCCDIDGETVSDLVDTAC